MTKRMDQRKVLESLANELFLEIFEHLNCVDLFQSFYTLNSRFNNLLTEHVRKYHLDFRFISKTSFETMCTQYLPTIADRIVSLHLSEDDETPQQLDMFISLGINLNLLNNLQSISFYNIRSIRSMHKILSSCRQLPCVAHIRLINPNFKLHSRYWTECNEHSISPEYPVSISNLIWSFPNLKHYTLQCKEFDYIAYPIYFPLPRVISLTLESLVICNFDCIISDIEHILKYTPRLKRLALHTILDDNENDQLQASFPSITRLNIYHKGTIDSLITIFRSMPNLVSLKLHTPSFCLDGNQWQQIIIEHLLKVTTFQFNMVFSLTETQNRAERIDQLLNTFRTSFWLNERKSFVGCHWYANRTPLGGHSYACLYTLPSVFHNIVKHCTDEWGFNSTCSNAKNDRFYNYVRKINHNHDLCRQVAPFSVKLPRVRSLGVYLHLNDAFWAVIPTLKHLVSLKIILDGRLSQNELQTLLDRSPHLYSLTLKAGPSGFALTPLICTSSSIRRLIFSEGSNSEYFNSVECTTLIASALGRQCRSLLLTVESRVNIIQLIDGMKNLQALTVKCLDDDSQPSLVQIYKLNLLLSENFIPRRLICGCFDENQTTNQLSSPTCDTTLEWVREHLPLGCSIARDTKVDAFIRIWIAV